MSDLGLVDAWQLWWQGRSTLGHELWGVSMIWWGRLGQTMAFVSGMTVVGSCFLALGLAQAAWEADRSDSCGWWRWSG